MDPHQDRDSGLPGASEGQFQPITFEVRGMAPAPQGSKRHLGNGVMVESCKAVKPWRLLVADAAVRSGTTLIRGPVSMAVTFVFARPKGHYGKRGLLPSAPRWHMVKPDGSKLLRSTEDALSKVLYEDDARIVSCNWSKRYAVGDELPGAVITLVPLAG
jgi:crossover junction endodeoxyribonuclease RusA